MVLCYRRFEDRPRDPFSIAPAAFRAQLQALKTQGIAVISLKDFLAWRRREKAIPARSCLITIDDGYASAYRVAWPILKEYGYPCTLFLYTRYINVGGQSLTWAQLEEMRDAGVEVGSLTVSHHDLRRAPKGQDYAVWLRHELYESKQLLEAKLGIQVSALAFPYGAYNEAVRQAALAAGYQALFTVEGQRLGPEAPADRLGRYAIESNQPQSFEAALDFGGGGEEAPPALQLAATEPRNDEHISTRNPTLRARLAATQDIDAESLEMRVSGLGRVAARYDAKGKVVSYAFTQRLVPKTYTVILSAKVNGQKVEVRWAFTVDGA
jgi:peptidoglycan/xylan/chitin deacetylase (PgdA/CDA1 family)